MSDRLQILAEAERAHGNATALLSPEGWAETEAPTFDGSDLHPARCEYENHLSANNTAHGKIHIRNVVLYSVAVRVAGRWQSSALNLVVVVDWTSLVCNGAHTNGMCLARVWRRADALVVDGGPAPFKTQGVVVGVAPQVLAVMLTDIAMKDHERHKKPHERNTERELVQNPDPQTKVWWEVDKYPWPLAAREMLYVERWVSASSGDRVVIARTSIELPEKPTVRGRVRARAFVVTELQRVNNGTRMTLCLEFNVGGNIPGRLVDGFLSGQSHTFRNLSRLAASGDGKRRIVEAEQQLLRLGQLQPGIVSEQQQQQQQQQQQRQQRTQNPSAVGKPSTASAVPLQRHTLPGRSAGSTALICSLVVVCGLTYRYNAWRKRVPVSPTVERAAAALRRAFMWLESLLGPGWPFYLVAVGGGSMLVGDMVVATHGRSRPGVTVATSRDARRMQRRTTPAFWQNLQDYRLSYGAPLLDPGVVQRVDDNGFQLPVAANTP